MSDDNIIMNTHTIEDDSDDGSFHSTAAGPPPAPVVVTPLKEEADEEADAAAAATGDDDDDDAIIDNIDAINSGGSSNNNVTANSSDDNNNNNIDINTLLATLGHLCLENSGGGGGGAPTGGPTTLQRNNTNDDKEEKPLPEKIKLDVGGITFTASRTTLCRTPGTVFESMFSGRHAFAAQYDANDGSYFIDRDGTHFRHILNYLRVGAVVTLPSDAQGKEELALEADFYGIHALVKAIRMPKVDVSEFVPQETLVQWEQETNLRAAFVAGKRMEPFHGLIPLFCPDHGPGDLPLLYKGIVSDDDKMMSEENVFMGQEIRKNRHVDDAVPPPPVTVTTLAQFETNFNREHPNVLNRLRDVLREEPVIIAGGAVLQALTGSPGIRTEGWWTSRPGNQIGDIDMFLYCNNTEGANRIARRIFFALAAADLEHWAVVRSAGVINIHRGTPFSGIEQKIQIVLRLYDSPAEVLVGFDVDCACCAYDGRQVWMTPRCKSALEKGVNVLNPLHAWPNKASYELRLAKYAVRGFGVFVPGLKKNRVDLDGINKSGLKNLKGMARLIKVVLEMVSCTPYRRRHWDRAARQMRTHERPRLALEVGTLRQEVVDITTEDDKLTTGLDTDYDDMNCAVFIPSVYGEEPTGLQWIVADFPRASETRDEAWPEIVECPEEPPEGIHRRLADAWETKKQSREYLNGTGLDKFELDNFYYSTAYKDE